MRILGQTLASSRALRAKLLINWYGSDCFAVLLRGPEVRGLWKKRTGAITTSENEVAVFRIGNRFQKRRSGAKMSFRSVVRLYRANKKSASLRMARPRCETAFFSSAVISAKVFENPSGMKSGS